MERILSDFRHRRTGMLVRCVIIAVVLAAAAWIPLLFSGSWAEWLRYVWTAVAAAVSTVVVILLIKAFAETLIIAPKKLAAQLSALPEQERADIIAAYPQAKTLGERWFLPDHILFYTNRRAVILRYDAIKTISPQGDDLRLGTSAGDIIMPVKSGESSAIIYAVLHGKYPEMKAEFDKPDENNKKQRN